MKLKIYGSRGSINFFSRKNIQYGGNTSCCSLDIDGHIVLLDCGTGVMQFYYDMKDTFKNGFKFDALLSHLHLDHIIGLSTFPPILAADSDIRIYTRSKQVFDIYRPPFWPVEISKLTKARLIEITDEKSFKIGDNIKVTPFFSEKHNQTAAYRIDADKSVVYLLDYEIKDNMERNEALVALCQNADLIIFDASYTSDDYLPRRGWGHSTFEDGVAFAEASMCKKMIFSHTCQDYTDEILNEIKSGLDDSKYAIAFDGMEIEV